MRRLLVMLLVMLGATTTAASAGVQDSQAAPAAQAAPKVLIFSHSTGYRHASIERAVAALAALGREAGYEIVASEDPSLFSAAGLDGMDAIILVSNSTRKDDPSSEFFTEGQRAAFQAFVRRGGGVVGIHAAADSHYAWPWYGRMIGARFTRHPEGTPTGTIRLVDPAHPANAGLSETIDRADEWYYFEDYDPTLDVLVTLDPASIGEADVNPNPISWAHRFEGGRVFYTALGHTEESWSDAAVLQHIGNGLRWVMARNEVETSSPGASRDP
jgi:type 1 glutamine amidotransferase